MKKKSNAVDPRAVLKDVFENVLVFTDLVRTTMLFCMEELESDRSLGYVLKRLETLPKVMEDVVGTYTEFKDFCTAYLSEEVRNGLLGAAERRGAEGGSDLGPSEDGEDALGDARGS